MPTEYLQHVISAVWKGGKATAEAAGAIEKTGKASETATSKYKNLGVQLAAGAASFYAVQRAAKEAWEFIGEGAQLQLTATRFDKLTESIGSTSDAMMGRLREATHGMVADSQLMQSASQIISLGLQGTEDGVVRLASLVSELGWDMSQVVLTFANNSKMRLDALGLSVTDVEARTQKLIAAGMNMDQAFDLAVIEAGEAKLKLLGSAADTTAGDMARVEASWKNMTDQLKVGSAEIAGPVLSNFDELTQIRNELIELYNDGAISEREFRVGIRQTTVGMVAGAEGAREYLDSLTAVTDEAASADSVMLRYATSTKEAAGAVDHLASVTAAWGDINEDAHERARQKIEETRAANEAAILAEREMTYTTQANVSAGKARADALAAEMEAARALARTYGGEFIQALQAGEEGSVNLKNELLQQAAQAGATREDIFALAMQTGEFSEAQIRAALEAAAMREAIALVGQEIANGNITVETGTQFLMDYETQLKKDYTIKVDAEDLKAAEEHAKRVKAALDAIPTMKTVNVTVNFASGGSYDPTLGTYVPPAANEMDAAGTGGWKTVPGGFNSDNFTVGMTSGERYAVVPQGQPLPDSGGSSGPQQITVNIFPSGPLSGTPSAIGAAVGREVVKRG